MAIPVTVEEVRNACPELGLSDSQINLWITSIGCRMDTCLEGAYADCPDIAKQIKILSICHFTFIQTNSGQRTSQTWPNGASASYDVYVKNGQGLNASQFGQMILLLDQEGCFNQIFSNKNRVFITTSGTSGSRRRPYTIGETLRDDY